MAVVKYKTWAELQKHNEECRKRRELERLEKIKKEEEEAIIPQEKKVSKGRKPKNREYMVVEENLTPAIEEVKEEEKIDEE